jgi:hypothetical protein
MAGCCILLLEVRTPIMGEEKFVVHSTGDIFHCCSKLKEMERNTRERYEGDKGKEERSKG